MDLNAGDYVMRVVEMKRNNQPVGKQLSLVVKIKAETAYIRNARASVGKGERFDRGGDGVWRLQKPTGAYNCWLEEPERTR